MDNVIKIVGAKENNLKNVSLEINRFVKLQNEWININKYSDHLQSIGIEGTFTNDFLTTKRSIGYLREIEWSIVRKSDIINLNQFTGLTKLYIKTH